MEGESVEKMWESLKKEVKECKTKKEIKIRKKRLGEHSWWDAECKRNKRKYTRTEDGTKEDKVRKSMCI